MFTLISPSEVFLTYESMLSSIQQMRQYPTSSANVIIAAADPRQAQQLNQQQAQQLHQQQQKLSSCTSSAAVTQALGLLWMGR